eukprot:11451.XXX_357183_357308_1 [CDS] Oithona nana genome sequencing.
MLCLFCLFTCQRPQTYILNPLPANFRLEECPGMLFSMSALKK